MPRALIVGPVIVPRHAALELTQHYDRDEAVNAERMADRSLRWQTLGPPKIETEIRGRGTIPPSLQALDFSQPIDLHCIAPVGILSATHTVTLPAARRSDADSLPHGRAILADGKVVRTALALAGDAATLTPVAGAVQYQALYYPRFTARCVLGRVSHTRGRTYSWSLTASEV